MAYAVVTIALSVLVGALALAPRQSAPPTIAEFAPQAVEQITDASSDSPGSRRAGRSETATLDARTGTDEAAPQSIDVARVRRCVGDPPRQIEDPQSPPCVPFWSGDNGGSTSRGVTGDEIRIAELYYNAHRSPALEAFFNRRFEFYGRRIHLISRSYFGYDDAGMRATARAVYEEDQTFASLAGVCDDCRGYLDELARLGVVGVHSYPLFPETYLAAHRPYMWTYSMANDRLFATVGNWYCARFAGRNAVHAGDPLLQVTRRKAGIILLHANAEGTSAEPMNAQLASCGSRTDAVIRDTTQTFEDPNSYAQYATFMENAMLQMKAAGVTTLTCLCSGFFLGFAARAATNQGYFPEWLVTDYVYNESLGSFRTYLSSSREQLRSFMLLLASPMHRPYSQHPSTWAIQEVSSDGYATDSEALFGLDVAYRSLLVLASGIQMAGPRLTPETFRRGLHRTRFPNPPDRMMAGAVGFSDGDHSMTDDAAEIWWSNTTRSPYADNLGTFCYVDHGARRRIGAFPTDDPFFKGPCDNGTT